MPAVTTSAPASEPQPPHPPPTASGYVGETSSSHPPLQVLVELDYPAARIILATPDDPEPSAASVAGWLERLVSDNVSVGLADAEANGLDRAPVAVVFVDSHTGNRLRFRDGEGAEELERPGPAVIPPEAVAEAIGKPRLGLYQDVVVAAAAYRAMMTEHADTPGALQVVEARRRLFLATQAALPA